MPSCLSFINKTNAPVHLAHTLSSLSTSKPFSCLCSGSQWWSPLLLPILSQLHSRSFFPLRMLTFSAHKTRCIQVQPSDVAAMIVQSKAGSDTIFTHNERVVLKYIRNMVLSFFQSQIEVWRKRGDKHVDLNQIIRAHDGKNNSLFMTRPEMHQSKVSCFMELIRFFYHWYIVCLIQIFSHKLFYVCQKQNLHCVQNQNTQH